MRKFTASLLVLLSIGTLFLFASKSNAASFASSYLRLDRSKTNTSLSGLVCAKPSSAGAGTEAKVLVTFPSDFTISSSTSNHTTSTSNLPSGATAWPNIGNSSNAVSGQTVTFSGGDLTSGSTLYCFNFTSASSTTGSTGSKTGTIVTKNDSNTTIDSSDYGLTIVTSDEITVSGTIPASASDYSAITAKLTEGTQFAENKEIEYKITYGTSLSYATDITVEASWSQGTIEGESTPSVNVVDYVVGSAGNAYGSTPAVIDTTNKKITWEIDSFPANTSSKTVTFKLKTTSNYTSSSKVSFTVSGRLIVPGTATDYSKVSADYKYSSTSTTSSSTSTSTSTSSTTPTPTSQPTKLLITNIEIREISDTNASIFIQTSAAARKTVKYGKSLSSLNQSKTNGFSSASTINLTELIKKTTYYFRIYVTDSTNNQVVSDVFTFSTSDSPTDVVIEPGSLIATSFGNIISDSKVNNGNSNTPNALIVPEGTVFKFKFAIKNTSGIKKITAYVRKADVLGINTEAEASSDSVELIEIENGVYEGTLMTKPEEGNYEIIARIEDTKGNITEQKITDLKIINRFTVLSKNNKPIEGARVLLYIYSASEKRYILLPSSILLEGNPLFTNSKGKLNLVLPKGKYRAEIDDIGYKPKTVDFELGLDKNNSFPIIYLESTGIGPISFIKYHIQSLRNIFIYHTEIYFGSLSNSVRFFDLLSVVAVGSFVFLSLLAFSKKHFIPLSSLHSYFFYLLDKKNRNQRYIHGVIYDEKDQAIPLANIYLINKSSEEIISSTKTSKTGEFFFRKNLSSDSQSEKEYLIMVMKKGYETSPLLPYKEIDHVKFKVNLNKKSSVFDLSEQIERFLSSIFGMTFESILMASFIFEILFLSNFGILKTFPFLVVSGFNFLLWTLHLRRHHHG